jgi:GntR family transcriptional regulator
MQKDHPGKPLHAWLKETLAGRIGGEWKPGCRIPGEMELCRQYGVSRITVRQALQALEHEGRILRRRGSGTVVAARPIEQRLTAMYGFHEALDKLGAAPEDRLLRFDVAQACSDTALRLLIGAGETVYEIDRLRLAAGEPYAWERSHVPVALATGLTGELIGAEGLYGALAACAGVVPGHAEETIGAAALPAEQAALLGIKKNAPALLVERVAFFGNTPVEYCVSWVRADRMKFKVLLK